MDIRLAIFISIVGLWAGYRVFLWFEKRLNWKRMWETPADDLPCKTRGLRLLQEIEDERMRDMWKRVVEPCSAPSVFPYVVTTLPNWMLGNDVKWTATNGPVRREHDQLGDHL